MDRGVVTARLESLRRCLLRLEERCPVDLATLLQDLDAQDIVSLDLTRAVQLALTSPCTGCRIFRQWSNRKPWAALSKRWPQSGSWGRSLRLT